MLDVIATRGSMKYWLRFLILRGLPSGKQNSRISSKFQIFNALRLEIWADSMLKLLDEQAWWSYWLKGSVDNLTLVRRLDGFSYLSAAITGTYFERLENH